MLDLINPSNILLIKITWIIIKVENSINRSNKKVKK